MGFTQGFEKVALNLNPVPAIKSVGKAIAKPFRPNSETIMTNAMKIRKDMRNVQHDLAAKAMGGGHGEAPADVVKRIAAERSAKQVSPSLKADVLESVHRNKPMNAQEIQQLRKTRTDAAMQAHGPQVQNEFNQEVKKQKKAALEEVKKPENIKATKKRQAEIERQNMPFYKKHKFLTAGAAFVAGRSLFGSNDQQPPPPPQVVQY